MTTTAEGQLASSRGLAVDGVLNLAGLNALNNALTGAGTLNINANNNAFNFGTKTGAAFKGKVNLGNSQLALSGTNVAALTKANLSVNSGATVNVSDKNQAIGGLTLNGGTAIFNNGSIKTEALSVAEASTIKVDPDGASARDANLLDQNVQSSQQLVNSAVELSSQDLAKLTLKDLNDKLLGMGTELDMNQGDKVAVGTYW